MCGAFHVTEVHDHAEKNCVVPEKAPHLFPGQSVHWHPHQRLHLNCFSQDQYECMFHRFPAYSVTFLA